MTRREVEENGEERDAIQGFILWRLAGYTYVLMT